MAYDSDRLLAAGGIKSVQRGTITIATGAASNTATITAVVVANTVVSLLGSMSAVDSAAGLAYLSLTNATTVTATRGADTASNTITSYQVVEYVA